MAFARAVRADDTNEARVVIKLKLDVLEMPPTTNPNASYPQSISPFPLSHQQPMLPWRYPVHKRKRPALLQAVD
jgi:hypothetical protein